MLESDLEIVAGLASRWRAGVFEVRQPAATCSQCLIRYLVGDSDAHRLALLEV
jgi:hypothetical protein